MYPGPFGMALSQTTTTSLSAELDAEMSATNDDSRISSSSGSDSSSREDNIQSADEREPLVLNLETTPLLDSMLPEGAMAMDRIFGLGLGVGQRLVYNCGVARMLQAFL